MTLPDDARVPLPQHHPGMLTLLLHRAIQIKQPLLWWRDRWLYVYLLHLGYLLLDEGTIVDAPGWSDEMRNIVAAVFRIEKHRDEKDIWHNG